MAGRAGCEMVLDRMVREGRTSTICHTAQRSVDNQRKRVWRLRTLLPGLHGESEVASADSPALGGQPAQAGLFHGMCGLRRWLRILMVSRCILALE